MRFNEKIWTFEIRDSYQLYKTLLKEHAEEYAYKVLEKMLSSFTRKLESLDAFSEDWNVISATIFVNELLRDCGTDSAIKKWALENREGLAEYIFQLLNNSWSAKERQFGHYALNELVKAAGKWEDDAEYVQRIKNKEFEYTARRLRIVRCELDVNGVLYTLDDIDKLQEISRLISSAVSQKERIEVSHADDVFGLLLALLDGELSANNGTKVMKHLVDGIRSFLISSREVSIPRFLALRGIDTFVRVFKNSEMRGDEDLVVTLYEALRKSDTPREYCALEFVVETLLTGAVDVADVNHLSHLLWVLDSLDAIEEKETTFGQVVLKCDGVEKLLRTVDKLSSLGIASGNFRDSLKMIHTFFDRFLRDSAIASEVVQRIFAYKGSISVLLRVLSAMDIQEWRPFHTYHYISLFERLLEANRQKCTELMLSASNELHLELPVAFVTVITGSDASARDPQLEWVISKTLKKTESMSMDVLRSLAKDARFCDSILSACSLTMASEFMTKADDDILDEMLQIMMAIAIT